MRLGAEEVSYVLKRSAKRRRAALMVDERGLVVLVPSKCSEVQLEKFIQDSAGWILKKLARWATNAPRARTFESGDLVDYLGQQLRLDITTGADRAMVMLCNDHRLVVRTSNSGQPTQVRQALAKWYKRHAQPFFAERVEYYGRQLKLRKLPKTIVSNATSRWGSCNSSREIRLSWRLMQARSAVIDYVVAHEVSHVLEMNHSPKFWSIVERLCPDYATHRAELDAMTRYYMSL